MPHSLVKTKHEGQIKAVDSVRTEYTMENIAQTLTLLSPAAKTSHRCFGYKMCTKISAKEQCTQ